MNKINILEFSNQRKVDFYEKIMLVPYRYSTYRLAKEYGVAQSTISDIVLRKATWIED